MLTLQADRRQVVGAFYRAFRQLVESRDYEPLRYERVRHGEAMSLLSGGFTEAELIGQLLVAGRGQAEARLQDVWPLHGGEPDSCWIDPPWGDWDVEARRKHLQEVFDIVGSGAFGAPIRAMRSETVERWIDVPNLGMRLPKLGT